MEEIGSCIATKLAECLWDPISRGARYWFHFKEFVVVVEKAKKELEVKLEDVNKRKEEADQETKEIMPSVKKWLDDVSCILEEVRKLQQEAGEGGKKCFNVSLKYSLARQMEDKAKQMMELKNNSNFDPFAIRTQLPGISYISSKDFVDFNSRKLTCNNLLEAIKDGNNKMIGLYGMGGSGKTTLAKEVGKKIDVLKLFDNVVVTVMSKTPNVFSIQQEIAEQIGLEVKEKTQLSRAQRLYLGLKNKKILIILDDVWEYPRLEDIGIPVNEGCCVLLTTRLRDLCVSMDCESIIELSILTDEEAWALFKVRANVTNVSMNEFDNVGRKIVDQCKGLPIAIVTVGSALRGKGIVEWESALWRLQHARPLDIDESLRGPYACLKLSYDNLPSLLAQSLFLLCAMFPEDHRIFTEDLIRFAKGALEIEEISYTMGDARSEILASINRLLDSCLLMHTDKQAYVKMHDLVRDVALWIAKKQHQEVLVDSQAVSRMIDENECLEKTKVISLWNLEDNFKLSNQLCCPTLEILLLHPQGFIKDFGGIEAIKVLALVTSSSHSQYWGMSTIQIQWSPQSTVSSLINLHTICFRGIILDDISFLCQLKNLEVLDLHGSQFNELPTGIVHMKKLKLLDVFKCEIEKSPLGAIEKCQQLEELYFWDCRSAIQENFSLSGLKRYVIYDSTCSSFNKDNAPFVQYFDESIEALRALCIQGFKVSTLNSLMKDLIIRANYLWMENCSLDYKDIRSKIKHLVVSHCLVDNVDANFLQTGQVLSHLVTLRLIKMGSLKQVFSQDSSSICSLPMLQKLFIERCRKLTTIFTHANVAYHCPRLEELEIWNCPKFDGIADEEATHGDPLLDDTKDNPYGNETVSTFVVVKADSFDHMRNQKLLTLFLSLKLIRIVRSGRRMKGVFEVQVMRGTLLESEESVGAQEEPLKLLNSDLRKLELKELPMLEYIWKGPKQSVSLCGLKYVELKKCPKLQNIFTLAIVASLPELKQLSVLECEAWEGVFCEESLKNLSPSNICFPKLKCIEIRGPNKVKMLFPYSMASHCPSLDELHISCFELERLFDDEAAYRGQLSLLKLKMLTFSELPKLREIFGEPVECPQQKNQNERGRPVNSDLWFISIIDLSELECIWKGPTQSVSLHRLEYVWLSECPKLKNIFTLTIVTSLPELKKLDVYKCEEWEGVFCEESLKNLSPSNVCFPKLEDIGIWECNKVKKLFPYSMASHCPSLDGLDVWRCFELERLFDEEEACRDQLSLLKLKKLTFSKLPKLREIFGEGLEFPQQKNQNMRGRVVNSELSTLTLEELPVLECIWKGPTQSVSLHRLEHVTLKKCPTLRNIFTVTIVRSLPELRSLHVSECKEWEGGFCEESLTNLSSSSSSCNVCFPKLENIHIDGCNKVKWLFSYSLAFHCPSLKEIVIENCCEIEGLVEGCEGEVRFPKLEEIKIRGCNKVKWLFSYSLASHCPSLEKIQIENCCEIEGVVEGCEGKVDDQEKLFPRLKDLGLKNLPKFRDIYKGYEFNPASGTISIRDCPSIQNSHYWNARPRHQFSHSI